MRRSFRWWLVTARSVSSGVFAIDRIFKWFVLRGAIPGVYNTDIAFSLPFPRAFLPHLIVLIVLALMVAFVQSVHGRRTADAVSLLCIIVGALSNLIDRLMVGSVIDYITVWKFPVFNLADVLISVGVAVVVIPHLFRRRV